MTICLVTVINFLVVIKELMIQRGVHSLGMLDLI